MLHIVMLLKSHVNYAHLESKHDDWFEKCHLVQISWKIYMNYLNKNDVMQ
jgi:hypothetical protein